MKRRTIAWMYLCFALFASVPVFAAPPATPPAAPIDPADEELAAHLREYVPQLLKDWNVPGLSLAVIRDGQVVLSEGYGFRDVEKKLPVTPETRFAIGSSTKAFTTAALGILVDEGKIEWDKPVRTWLPAFRLHDAYATEHMTPRDLVSHRSGLPRHDLMWYGTAATRAELVSRLGDLEPNAELRTRWQYQNLMYMTAGHLVEQVSGKSWEDFVRERIFTPLGMTASDLSIRDLETVENRALAYRKKPEEDGGDLEKIPYRNIDAIGPAGSINSNVLDMAKWVRLHLGDGTWEGKPLLTPTTFAELHKPAMLMDVSGSPSASLLQDPDLPIMTYALGWFVQPYRGHLVVHHGGNIDGFSAFVTMLPKQKHGLVILTNLDGTSATMVLANHLFDRLLGLPEKSWSGDFLAKRAELRAAAREAEKSTAAARKTGTKPDHPLDGYAGVYTHPSYGDLRIEKQGEKQGNRLALTYNAALVQVPLEHWHYETWNITEGAGEGTKVQFLTDVQGDVNRVSVPLEPSVADIVFTRKASEVTDLEAFRRFTGEYELAGMVATVAIEGGRLLLTVPGQPPRELLSYRDGELTVKELTGYRLRFEEENGVVKAAIFLQPNGTFRAEKK
jgi:CubicO group peptidase (beta-lactamase class C family)